MLRVINCSDSVHRVREGQFLAVAEPAEEIEFIPWENTSVNGLEEVRSQADHTVEPGPPAEQSEFEKK